jgi:Protein of unknown function (DUF2877)
MYLAAASSALRSVLAGPARRADLLGLSRAALYLKTEGQPGVLVVLSHDSVRLPCGLVLPSTTAELPLTSLARLPERRSAGFVVGDGAVRWMGPAGPAVVRAVREWAPPRPARGAVAASALGAIRAMLEDAVPGGADPGTGTRLTADLTCQRRAGVAAAMGLLGRGPGLTPSGDDVLAGFLVGAAAFGLEAGALRQAIVNLAPARTTALSAALLWHAARGECIDELAAVATILTGQRQLEPDQAAGAVSRLLSVGHSSGAALARGLLIAAESAGQAEQGRAA